MLTWLRHHSARKHSTNYPYPLENGNEGEKNRKLNVLYLQPKSSLLLSDCKSHLRPVLSRKNYIRRRRVTSVRVTLTYSSIGFRLKSGEKSTSNKIARLEKIFRGANQQKNRDEGNSYRSILPKSHPEKCRL